MIADNGKFLVVFVTSKFIPEYQLQMIYNGKF